MYFAGIIAEYHPFHAGHAWQIARAKALGAQYVAVALSAGAVQRGQLPLLPEAVRVRAALDAGADLVFALPAPCAAATAEQFAAAGVAVLAGAGCDTLVFGMEHPDAALCAQAAEALASPAYTDALRTALDESTAGFAAARQAALAQVCPRAAALVQNPNDNLGVEYARANLLQQAGLALCPLPRQGVGHHDTAASGYASASHLRTLWAQSGPEALAPYVPQSALALYRQAHADGLDLDSRAADIAILSRLRLQADKGFAGVRGISEGLDYALARAVRTAPTTESLADALTSRRYPRARMRRLALDAAIGWSSDLPILPPYLQVLGARRTALPLLAGAKLPADTSLSNLKKRSPACTALAEAHAAAVDLAALCRRSPQPMGTAYTQKPVLL